MSLVPLDSCGIRATASPTPTLAPSSRFTIALPGRKYWAGTSVPGSSLILAVQIDQFHGRTHLLPALGRSLTSSTTMEETGQLVGLTSDGHTVDHVFEVQATRHFGDDRVGVRVPSSRRYHRRSPLRHPSLPARNRKGSLWLSLVRPISSMMVSSVEREVITSLSELFRTNLAFCNLDATGVLHLDAALGSRSGCGHQPMWKVRIVIGCGSPMD